MIAGKPMGAGMPTVMRSKYAAGVAAIPLVAIWIPDGRERQLDERAAADLEASIGRIGLQQPISLRNNPKSLPDGRTASWELIFGLHRLTAFRRLAEAGERLFQETGSRDIWDCYLSIPAVTYPEGTPDALAKVIELTENLCRKELSVKDRAAHTVRLAAVFKEPEVAAILGGEDSRRNSGNPNSGKTRGRKRGVTQKVAEQAGVDHNAVRGRVKAAEGMIGEKIDIEGSSAETLHQQADKIEAEAQTDKKQKTDRGKRVEAKLFIGDPKSLTSWIKRRIEVDGMTLEQVAMYRDALAVLYADLAAQTSPPPS